MKSYKVFAYLLIALPALLLQSCLKDDDDKFSESSSARAEEYLEKAQNTLISSTNGWVLDYYPQRNQSYGGYTYAITFDKNQATVYFENQPDKSETSLYSMKGDDGPVLSFDSYNSMIHFFSTPSSSLYEGYEGDFEFVIDSIGDDRIKVHGKRSQNTMYFRRLTEPAADYVNKVIDMGDSFGLYAAVGNIGGRQGQLFFNRSNRQIDITVDSTHVQSSYNFTDKGIKLYKPVTIDGVTIDEINYNNDQLALSADNGTQLSGIYDPAIITNAIGTVGSDDRAFTRTFNRLNHLDQFDFVVADDWCTVSIDGNSLSVSATENETGNMRSTTVYVISKLSRQVYNQFTVSQMSMSDILGSYNLYYYNSNGELVSTKATIAQSGRNLKFSFDIDMSGSTITLSTRATFNVTTGSIDIAGGYSGYQALGSYNIINSFLFADASYVAFSPNVIYSGHFNFSKEYGTTITFSGYVDEYPIEAWILWAAETQEISSLDDTAGYFEWLESPTLQKVTTSGSKSKAYSLPATIKAPQKEIPNIIKRFKLK